MTLYAGNAGEKEHTALSKHFTAEKEVTEFVAGVGNVTRFVAVSRANHWLDCAWEAAAALSLCGWSIVPSAPTPAGNGGSWFGQSA